MSLKVVFNTWSGAFFNPGGGEVQLMKTLEQLKKGGHSVDFYDQWRPQREIDIFHQFSIQPGVEYPMREYRNLGKKIALSTILWVEYPKKSDAYTYIRKIFDLADILLTNSDMESQKLAAAFDVDLMKFHKTVNGVSSEYLNTVTQKNFREHFKVEGDFILTLANIDRRKNTHHLVDACRSLGKQLISIGHIRDEEYFQEFKDSYRGFRHLGPVLDVDLLKSAFQQAELFVLPSLCETPGIAALEAASQGAKVVITKEGSTQEYFGNLVTYVDPLSLESIVQGIQLESSQHRVKESLIRHIAENFTWRNAASQVEQGYRKIVSSGSF